MIGRITGILAAKQPPQVLVDVNGVGYEIDVPMSTFYNLPAIGEKVSLLTHLAVFFIASVLVGRSSAFEGLRKNAGRWLALNLLLAAIIVPELSVFQSPAARSERTALRREALQNLVSPVGGAVIHDHPLGRLQGLGRDGLHHPGEKGRFVVGRGDDGVAPVIPGQRPPPILCPGPAPPAAARSS